MTKPKSDEQRSNLFSYDVARNAIDLLARYRNGFLHGFATRHHEVRDAYGMATALNRPERITCSLAAVHVELRVWTYELYHHCATRVVRRWCTITERHGCLKSSLMLSGTPHAHKLSRAGTRLSCLTANRIRTSEVAPCRRCFSNDSVPTS